MSITTDRPGRVLAGRYQLVTIIGRGSFAVVHLAEDLRLSRRVAVKLLHPGLATDETFAQRFRTEAELLAGLNHPHVLSVFDWGEEGDDAFLVTEYLPGGNLAQLIRRGVRLGVPEATALGAKVAHGLAHAHRHGLVHRDVKPANLLFDEAGEVRIADFGIARAIAEAATTTPEGTLVGTARYASPEQAEARSLDGRSDVYSLALVLFEAVTGTVPFVGETDAATLLRRVGATLPVSRDLGPLYPVLVQAAIADPLVRLDAAELAIELELLARTLPTPTALPIVLAELDLGDGAAGGLGAHEVVRHVDGSAVPATSGAGAADASGVRALGAGADRGLPLRLHAADRTVFDQHSEVAADDAPTTIGSGGPPGRRRRGHRGRKIFGAVFVVLVLVAGGAASYVRFVLYDHHVPALSGLTASRAQQALERVGLGFAVGGHAYSPSTPVGEVVAQSLAPGRALRSGTVVTVTVSLGERPVLVPLVTGRTRAAAVRALVARHLAPVVTTVNSETVPRGRVVSESPSSGSDLPGTSVDLAVSLGPAPRTIPEFPSSTYAAAAASLEMLRLVPSEQQAYSTTVPTGDVISTSPAEGAGGVAVGSTVVVTVSKGPQMVVIPPLSGLTVTAAVALLRTDGLDVTEVIGPPFATTAVTSDPAPGTSVTLGSAVTLYSR